MRKTSKPANSTLHSESAPRSNQKKNPSRTNRAEMTASNAVAQDPAPLELLEGDVSLEERRHLIAEAAYYRAERRNFAPGNELEDWLNAEAEITGRLSPSQ